MRIAVSPVSAIDLDSLRIAVDGEDKSTPLLPSATTTNDGTTLVYQIPDVRIAVADPTLPFTLTVTVRRIQDNAVVSWTGVYNTAVPEDIAQAIQERFLATGGPLQGAPPGDLGGVRTSIGILAPAFADRATGAKYTLESLLGAASWPPTGEPGADFEHARQCLRQLVCVWRTGYTVGSAWKHGVALNQDFQPWSPTRIHQPWNVVRDRLWSAILAAPINYNSGGAWVNLAVSGSHYFCPTLYPQGEYPPWCTLMMSGDLGREYGEVDLARLPGVSACSAVITMGTKIFPPAFYLVNEGFTATLAVSPITTQPDTQWCIGRWEFGTDVASWPAGTNDDLVETTYLPSLAFTASLIGGGTAPRLGYQFRGDERGVDALIPMDTDYPSQVGVLTSCGFQAFAPPGTYFLFQVPFRYPDGPLTSVTIVRWAEVRDGREVRFGAERDFAITLPAAPVGTPAAAQISATSGTGTYQWELTAGDPAAVTLTGAAQSIATFSISAPGQYAYQVWNGRQPKAGSNVDGGTITVAPAETLQSPVVEAPGLIGWKEERQVSARLLDTQQRPVAGRLIKFACTTPERLVFPRGTVVPTDAQGIARATVFANLKGSVAMRDTTVEATVVGTEMRGTTQTTVVRVDLAVQDLDLSLEIPEEEEDARGGLVAVNNDFDSGAADAEDQLIPDGLVPGAIANENDLLRIRLQLYPQDLDQSRVRLSAENAAGMVRLWRNADRSGVVVLDADLEGAEIPEALWVEGWSPSALRAIKIHADFKQGDTVVYTDRVLLSVIGASMELVAPEGNDALGQAPPCDSGEPAGEYCQGAPAEPSLHVVQAPRFLGVEPEVEPTAADLLRVQLASGAGGELPPGATVHWAVADGCAGAMQFRPEGAEWAPSADTSLPAPSGTMEARVRATAPGRMVIQLVAANRALLSIATTALKIDIVSVDYGTRFDLHDSSGQPQPPEEVPEWQDGGGPGYAFAMAREEQITYSLKALVKPSRIAGTLYVSPITQGILDRVDPHTHQFNFAAGAGSTTALPIQLRIAQQKVGKLDPLSVAWGFSGLDRLRWWRTTTTATTAYVVAASPVAGAVKADTSAEVGLWKTPLARFGVYETLVAQTCAWAAGVQSPHDAGDRIWAKLATRSATGWKYWGDGVNCISKDSVRILISEGNANCLAWSRYWRDALRLHGVQYVHLARSIINAAFAPTAPPVYRQGDPLLLVRNYTFSTQPEALMPAKYLPYTHRFVSPFVSDDPGVPAQGNDEPVSTFAWHWIVNWEGKYFDPAYGKPASGAGLTQGELNSQCVAGCKLTCWKADPSLALGTDDFAPPPADPATAEDLAALRAWVQTERMQCPLDLQLSAEKTSEWQAALDAAAQGKFEGAIDNATLRQQWEQLVAAAGQAMLNLQLSPAELQRYNAYLVSTRTVDVAKENPANQTFPPLLIQEEESE